MMTIKFTILGGTGVIGSYLTNFLRSSGIPVDTPERNERDTFNKPLGHVIYCIGLTADFREHPFATVEAHVCFLKKLLEKTDFSSFLYLSSTRIYSGASSGSEQTSLSVNPFDSSDLYNLSKLMGESLCLHCGRKGIRIARLSNVVGGINEDPTNFIPSLIHDAQNGSILLRSNLRSEKDYIHIDDVVQVLQKIAIKGKESVYNLASGKQITHRQWLDHLVAKTGCSVEIEANVPVIRFLPVDVSKIKNEFGFSPQSPFNVLKDLA